MGEPDSWEDDAPQVAASTQTHSKLNANAPSFTFNPNAASFNPSAPAFTPSYLSSQPVDLARQSLASPPEPCSVEPVNSAPVCVPTDSSPEVLLSEPMHDDSREEDPTEADLNGALRDSLVSLSVNDTSAQQDTSMDDSEDEKDDNLTHLNVVFIGHVDAGKSTIGGQTLYLTGQVDERSIQKYEREAKEKNRDSWYMAYIMDTNEEERAKGKTVEVGRAHFETAQRRFTILDAPGHKNYVPNMISGASQADVGVLVISARKGEFETGFERGGQTREHAQLAKTLGVSKLIVVVNKMDEASVQWSKERFDEIEKKLSPFIRSCGYNVKKDVIFLPISGLQGYNMKERVPKSVCPWWDGPSLFEALDEVQMPVRDPSAPFRMPLIDKYRDMGTMVMGKIESGTVRRGDNLMVMPNKAHVKVVAIMRDADEVRTAKPGENLRIKISGVEEEDILPGFVLCSVEKPIPAVREFDAQLQVLELLDHKAIFTAGYKAVLHIHSVVDECEIIELLQQIDPKTKKPAKKKPLFVKSGAVVVVRIQVIDVISVEQFEDFPQLGRFTLRDEGKTVAIGKVTNVILD
ncbi:hypothetical protein KP509_02G096500 [Ceratopteris richardii]|uniref:Eukaryotic peptide chain release factor GTP-binding subunit n=1 Tax=Ceratopteris richardii TaxID=49495 RepID=A0A8T2VH38_CERRI|nr:hypothetical protein KP509_02G096500 [Ceratopteris richardii]KAH7444895.1 hypothetical protein KP509_02G096500 [Ceratopteris richardii]KAH7444896.1 hypothetical protein KP509_02G096500 [Ceratopteris richardii]